MYWRKSIEDLCEKCSTSHVFRIQFKKTAARTLLLKRCFRSAAGRPGCCFTLCVCFCVVPSLNLNENPLRPASSVREKLSPLRRGDFRYTTMLSRHIPATFSHWPGPGLMCPDVLLHLKSCLETFLKHFTL